MSGNWGRRYALPVAFTRPPDVGNDKKNWMYLDIGSLAEVLKGDPSMLLDNALILGKNTKRQKGGT